MAKGGLTGAKARINKLEQDKAQLQQIIIHNNHEAQKLAAFFENKISELSSTGKAALTQAQQAIEDLQSVNAELRDDCEEVQEQRDNAQDLAAMYKHARDEIRQQRDSAQALATMYKHARDEIRQQRDEAQKKVEECELRMVRLKWPLVIMFIGASLELSLRIAEWYFS